MDVNIVQNLEDDCITRKNRIRMYKSILNYYRGRSLSLNVILASKQEDLNITPDMKTYKALRKNIQRVHEDVTLVQTVKNCIKLINFSLACFEITNANYNLNREYINKIEGIIYFSKAILKLHNESCTELELMEKMINYNQVQGEKMNSVQLSKENEINVCSEDLREKIEKAKLHIYKINLMRKMKSVLIGYIFESCPDLCKDIQQFQSPLRRDLTEDDFRNTWDVGLPSDSSETSHSST